MSAKFGAASGLNVAWSMMADYVQGGVPRYRVCRYWVSVTPCSGSCRVCCLFRQCFSLEQLGTFDLIGAACSKSGLQVRFLSHLFAADVMLYYVWHLRFFTHTLNLTSRCITCSRRSSQRCRKTAGRDFSAICLLLKSGFPSSSASKFAGTSMRPFLAEGPVPLAAASKASASACSDSS